MNAPSSAGFANDLPVIITRLGAVETAVDGVIIEISGKTMTLRATHELPRGGLVRIEAADTLWLGGISECVPYERSYKVRVTLAHALYGLAELARLAERFAGSPPSEERTPLPGAALALAH
ncbi:MAG: hypothetical protein ACR2I2_07740 [Bryobacteraceae bacterium]